MRFSLPRAARRISWPVVTAVVLIPTAPVAQSGPDWAAVRQRAVALAQEIDVAERRLKGAVTADAMTDLLRSERFTIERLALGAAATRENPAVLAAVVRHLFTRTEGIVLVDPTGDTIYYRLLKFDEFTGEFEYRAGNTAPRTGRVKGVDIEMPGLRIPGYGDCKGQLRFAPSLTASGTADCGISRPITLTFQ